MKSKVINVAIGLFVAMLFGMAGCGGGGGGGGGDVGSTTPPNNNGSNTTPADFTGKWSTTYASTLIKYEITQSGNSIAMTRTTPMLAGLTYNGVVSGNTAVVEQYINNTHMSTMTWTKINSTTITAVVNKIDPVPGYTNGASVGDTITLSKQLYSISGRVSVNSAALANVLVSTGNASAITDSSGYYIINSLDNGSYTVTPALSSFTFTPASQTVTVNGLNVYDQDFSAATYGISGKITNGGLGMSGVAVALNGSNIMVTNTDSNGNYSFGAVQNGNYTITLGKFGFTFIPVSQSIIVSGTDIIGRNFAATANNSSGVSSSVIRLPKTGQTVSQAAGDDGALQKGVTWPSLRFTDNSNGTVIDNLTGLVWLKNAICMDTAGGINIRQLSGNGTGSIDWWNSTTWVNNLASGICGLSDNSVRGEWRLPSRSELQSLVDRSKSAPALPAGHPFTGVPFNTAWYWSSSTTSSNAWYVDMVLGQETYKDKGQNNHVWAVRGGQYTTLPSSRFTDNGNGTITDNLTRLIWLKDANCSGTQGTWTTALASANALASGSCGLSDDSSAGQWRLPNINELESLVDISQSEPYHPALPTGHPFTNVHYTFDGLGNGTDYGYWSSSSISSGSAWGVTMVDGAVIIGEKTGYIHSYVWPVRDGH